MIAWRGFILTVATSLCLSGVPTRAADAPEKPETPAKTPAPTAKPPLKNTAVPAAIAALTKEYKAYQTDPKTAKLRAKSDYFKENPSDEITPDAIMKGLETTISGGGGLEAYVKWQLLSGVQGKFPDELVKRAIAVYRRAPAPGPHPGMNKRDLSRAVNGLKKEGVSSAQSKFDAAIEQAAEANEVFIQYRDELFARLPGKIEAISAGLEDVSERVARGLNANLIFDSVANAIRSWALGDAKAGQAKAMAGSIESLKAQVAKDDNKPYTKIGADAKWAAGTATNDVKKLDELVKFLEANSSGGGLKFKDPPAAGK
jgi:hypothetical protein